MADSGLIGLSVELCGKLADLCGREIRMMIPHAGCRVSDILILVLEHDRALEARITGGKVRACVNETIAPPQTMVIPGDTVALFPPVSGG